MSWEQVDEGWGRRAVDFATMSEPSNCREYVFVHSRLGVGPDDRLLDVACGSGLAMELARMRCAEVAGIDASQRLVAVARDRNPQSDVVVGDMNTLPWDDESFDVATSFRGIWGTTPLAIADVHRVLRPGGRVAITVWGNVGKSTGAWMFSPFQWADHYQLIVWPGTHALHSGQQLVDGRCCLGVAMTESDPHRCRNVIDTGQVPAGAIVDCMTDGRGPARVPRANRPLAAELVCKRYPPALNQVIAWNEDLIQGTAQAAQFGSDGRHSGYPAWDRV